MNTAAFLLSTGHDDAVALVDDTSRHTYRDLRAQVASCRDRIEGLGLPAGSPIALVAPNGLFWIAGYLAILAAGHVAVPMPTIIARDEFARRMEWIGGRAALLGAIPARKLRGDGDGWAALVEGDLDADAAPLDLTTVREVPPGADAAYLFTSGTTGVPRAVRITHGNIRANTESILGFLPLRESDSALVVLPFSYVFGASVLHTHLRVGATLVNQATFAYPESVVDRLEEERCTVFAGVPVNFHVLQRSSTFGSRDLPHLRIIQQAGGRLSPAIVTELLSAHPQAQLFVMYGQTEATARLSYMPPAELAARPGSIGRGIPGVDLRVVSESGADIAPGEVGEIWAHGDNVSPGYLNDPERTAQKMPGGVLHTGDLATVDDEGYIYIVDRSEDFIKSWGHRITSQDVESTIMELPEVVSVAVVGVPDDMAGEKVAAVVVQRPGSKLTARDIITQCRGHLPKHMVPALVAFIDRLPLNSSGKVVKREVREFCVQHFSAPS